MMGLRRACILGMLTFVSVGLLRAAEPSNGPDPVRDCPVGLVCFRPAEIGEIDIRLIELERDLKIARAKVARLGWTIGCGTGGSVAFDGGKIALEQHVVMCGAMWGLRF